MYIDTQYCVALRQSINPLPIHTATPEFPTLYPPTHFRKMKFSWAEQLT